MRPLNPAELKLLIDTPGAALVLLDVREAWEFDLCRIEGSRNLPVASVATELQALDSGAKTVVICHHGVRSQRVASFLAEAGFTDVCNLEGGIDAWARDLDPGMARY